METFSNELSEKSANQLWKESGTILPFKDWIEREKLKGRFIFNKKVADTLTQMKDNLLSDFNKNNPNNQSNQQDDSKPSSNVLGLSKTALIASVVIIVGSIVYTVYRNNKK